MSPVYNQKKEFQSERIACVKALRREQAWCLKGSTRARRLAWPEHMSEVEIVGIGDETSIAECGHVVRSRRALWDTVRLPAF